MASAAIGPWLDSPPRNSGPVAASLVSPSSSTSLADASYIIVSSLYRINPISSGHDILGAWTSENPDEMDVLRALAHPVRWGILQRLAAEPGICACDFTEFFDVSQPTISVHLKVLREAGLVTSKRIGTTICYSIAPGQLTRLGARLGRMAATAGEGQPHSHQREAPTRS